MHMGNELMSPATGIALIGISGSILAYAGHKASAELDESRIPLAGVMGAFVFAAQMINFPVLAGTSGHLGGGMLLAIIFGPHLATIIMASILTIQCLIFQDGGLLALGANIFNLAIVPAYLGYRIYEGIRTFFAGSKGMWAAAFGSAFLSVLAGALLVPVQVRFSGSIEIPFLFFTSLMGGVHVLIGIVEGVITISVLKFLLTVKPDMFNGNGFVSPDPAKAFNRISLVFLGFALFLSGFLSYYASSHPDGLEWALEKIGIGDAGHAEETAVSGVGEGFFFPIMPDYRVPEDLLPDSNPRLLTGIAGAAGSVITVVVLVIVGGIVRRIHKRAVRSAPEDIRNEMPD